MTAKRRGKKTKRNTQHAQGEPAAAQGAPPDPKDRSVCEHCGCRHDDSEDHYAMSETEEEEFRKHIREQYSWEALVKKHGVEGAAIIGDCLDFEFDF